MDLVLLLYLKSNYTLFPENAGEEDACLTTRGKNSNWLEGGKWSRNKQQTEDSKLIVNFCFVGKSVGRSYQYSLLIQS